ncbi:ABC transporter [Reticulomyxa filosa]|uniref:ABC transporter n=1 Tax=Reticulomyxa filosa TaxID=46433 RepID=X6MPQ8_RETFI|nr:ABC transporter [Reticulomyxa filosa]|eukprot:ETO15080.1 ABC transporter [Reticulomyxa filosa]
MADGLVVYNGKAGQEPVNYFSKLGLVCPSYLYDESFFFYNPADYFLDIVSRDFRNEQGSEERIQKLKEEWQKVEKETITHETSVTESLKELEKESGTVRSSFPIQFQVLMKRGFRQVFRNKFALTIRLFFSLLFSLILSAVYSNTGYGQKSIQDRTGILFFVVVNQSFQALISTVNAFTVEKAIIIRERQVLFIFLKHLKHCKLIMIIIE